MKRNFPLPLTVDCEGLSRKRTLELLGRLRAHFATVEFWEDEISAGNPLSLDHYIAAWIILDQYGVKVT